MQVLTLMLRMFQLYQYRHYTLTDGQKNEAYVNVTGRPVFLNSVNPVSQCNDAQSTADSANQNLISSRTLLENIHAVTNQPTVMTSSNTAKQHITCYGCTAHVINLLAGDFRITETYIEVLDSNRDLAKFYKVHATAGELLQHVTKQNYSESSSLAVLPDFHSALKQ